MIQAAAYLLAIGFRVLFSGHELSDLMQADLSGGEQSHQSTGEGLCKRQIKGVESGLH